MDCSLFLVVALVVAVAAATLLKILSLLLKGSTIVCFVSQILAVQETVEFIFSVVVVAVVAATFLVPAGLALVR